MKARAQLEEQVKRWMAAGLIDEGLAERILAHESLQERRSTLHWPVFLALTFGGILLAAGATLFVAAHWSKLSPAARFSLVLLMVAVFQAGGVLATGRFRALSTTMHGLGTAVLGAAIFLTAQIFNLHENWATGVLLWAVGAGCGYALLRDWVQAAMAALLVPAWLISEWDIATNWQAGGRRPLAMGLILTALCYLSARIGDQASTARRTMVWIGGLALLPCAGVGIAMAAEDRYQYLGVGGRPEVSALVLAVCWVVAVAGPLAFAWFTRRKAAWLNLLWAMWAWGLVEASSHIWWMGAKNWRAKVAIYALCATGSVGLVAWGLYERRKERLNLGVAAFAVSVLFFYFDSFMDKLGRSASLLVLGLLCLAGGYALEVTRRRLVARMETNP
jgi:predicted membrane protein DUF2157